MKFWKWFGNQKIRSPIFSLQNVVQFSEQFMPPLQGFDFYICCRLIPRALPWANIFHPLGVEGIDNIIIFKFIFHPQNKELILQLPKN